MQPMTAARSEQARYQTVVLRPIRPNLAMGRDTATVTSEKKMTGTTIILSISTNTVPNGETNGIKRRPVEGSQALEELVAVRVVFRLRQVCGVDYSGPSFSRASQFSLDVYAGFGTVIGQEAASAVFFSQDVNKFFDGDDFV